MLGGHDSGRSDSGIGGSWGGRDYGGTYGGTSPTGDAKGVATGGARSGPNGGPTGGSIGGSGGSDGGFGGWGGIAASFDGGALGPGWGANLSASRGLMSVADQARYDAGLRQGPFGGWYDTPASIGPVGFNNRGIDYGTRTAGAQAAYTAGKKADSMAKRDAMRTAYADLKAGIAALGLDPVNNRRATEMAFKGDLRGLAAYGVDQGLLGDFADAHREGGLLGGLFSGLFSDKKDVNTIAEREDDMLSKGWAVRDPVTGDLVAPAATFGHMLSAVAPMGQYFSAPVAESVYGATESVPAAVAAKVGVGQAGRLSDVSKPGLGLGIGLGALSMATGVPGLSTAAGLLSRASAMQDAGVVAPDRSNISSHTSQGGGDRATWADYANMALMSNPAVSPGQVWNRYMLYG